MEILLLSIQNTRRETLRAYSGGLKVLRAPGKKQYAGLFQQCWKKLLYSIVGRGVFSRGSR